MQAVRFSGIYPHVQIAQKDEPISLDNARSRAHAAESISPDEYITQDYGTDFLPEGLKGIGLLLTKEDRILMARYDQERVLPNKTLSEESLAFQARVLKIVKEFANEHGIGPPPSHCETVLTSG